MIDLDDLRQQLELLNDERLLSILRERDDEQWRPEVFDIIASILRQRGVSLNADPQRPENSEATAAYPPDQLLVTVAGYFNRADAEQDRAALEERGLRAWIFDEDVSQEDGLEAGFELRVLKEDFKPAMAIINSDNGPLPDLPDEIAEPPCPKCGSRETTEAPEMVESFDGSSRSYRPVTKEIWLNKCSACGHKWSDSDP
jgi:hypothetical protein